MSAFVRNLALVLAALSVAAGLFTESLLSAVDVKVPSASEIRWSLTLGMPVALLVSFAWLNQQPAKNVLAAALQSIALVAIFLAPYWWVARHAQ